MVTLTHMARWARYALSHTHIENHATSRQHTQAVPYTAARYPLKSYSYQRRSAGRYKSRGLIRVMGWSNCATTGCCHGRESFTFDPKPRRSPHPPYSLAQYRRFGEPLVYKYRSVCCGDSLFCYPSWGEPLLAPYFSPQDYRR